MSETLLDILGTIDRNLGSSRTAQRVLHEPGQPTYISPTSVRPVDPPLFRATYNAEKCSIERQFTGSEPIRLEAM